MSDLPVTMDARDLETLRWATQHLEHPSLAVRLSSVIGTPIEIGVKLLPRPIISRSSNCSICDSECSMRRCGSFSKLATTIRMSIFLSLM